MGLCSLTLLALVWTCLARASTPQIYVSAVYTERSARHLSLFGSVVFDISDAHTLALLAADTKPEPDHPSTSDTISSPEQASLSPRAVSSSSSNASAQYAAHERRPPRFLRLLDMGAGSCCEYPHPSLTADQASVCEPSPLPALLPEQILLVDGRARTRMLVPMPYLDGRAFTCVFSFRPHDFYANMNLTLDFSFPERFRREARGRRSVVCSVDEVLNATLGPARAFCAPVNCLLKYMGDRNFFNRTSRLCQDYRLCPDGQLLDLFSNTCIVLTVQVAPNFTLPLDVLTRNITSLNPATSTTASPSVNRTANVTSTPASSCACNNGVRVNVTGCRCECLPGWKSDPGNATHFTWCLRRADTEFTPINQGSSDMSSAGKLIIAVFSITAALVVFCCCYACRHNVVSGARFCAAHLRRKNANGQAAAQDGDPSVGQHEGDPAGSSGSGDGTLKNATLCATRPKLISSRTQPAECVDTLSSRPLEGHGTIATIAAAAGARARNSPVTDSVTVSIPMDTFPLGPDAAVAPSLPDGQALCAPRLTQGLHGSRAGDARRTPAQRAKMRSEASHAETSFSASARDAAALRFMPAIVESPLSHSQTALSRQAAVCEAAKRPTPRSRESPAASTNAAVTPSSAHAPTKSAALVGGSSPIPGPSASPAARANSGTKKMSESHVLLSSRRPSAPTGARTPPGTPCHGASMFSEEMARPATEAPRSPPGSPLRARAATTQTAPPRQESSTAMSHQSGNPGLLGPGLGLDLPRVAAAADGRSSLGTQTSCSAFQQPALLSEQITFPGNDSARAKARRVAMQDVACSTSDCHVHPVSASTQVDSSNSLGSSPKTSQHALFISTDSADIDYTRAPSPAIANAVLPSLSKAAGETVECVMPHVSGENLSEAGDLYVVDEQCFHDGNYPVMRRQTAIADYFFGTDGSQGMSGAAVEEKPAWVRDSVLSVQSASSQIVASLTQDAIRGSAHFGAVGAEAKSDLLKEIERACKLRAIEREKLALQAAPESIAPASADKAEREQRRRQMQQDSHQLEYYFHTSEDKLSLQQLERSMHANPAPSVGLYQHAMDDQPNLLWLMDGTDLEDDLAEDTPQLRPASSVSQEEEGEDLKRGESDSTAAANQRAGSEPGGGDGNGESEGESDDGHGATGVRACSESVTKGLPRSTSFC